METTLLLVIALFILIPFGVLTLGGRLLTESTRELPPRKNARSRLRRDLAGIEDVLVSFFAHSKVAVAVLGVLTTQSGPMPYNALRRETASVLFGARPREAMLIGAVLPAMLLAQLVRTSSRGFVLTPAGREAHRRIYAATKVSEPVIRVHPSQYRRPGMRRLA